MLAQRIATTLLRIEGTLMRKTLDAITAAMAAVQREGSWRCADPTIQQLDVMLVLEQSFEETFHHPKCAALEKALQERSPEASAQAALLDGERKRVDLLITAARSMLVEMPSDDPCNFQRLSSIWERYKTLRLGQMQWEESVLLPMAEQALDEAQWSHVASVFSRLLPANSPAPAQEPRCAPGGALNASQQCAFVGVRFVLERSLAASTLAQVGGAAARNAHFARPCPLVSAC